MSVDFELPLSAQSALHDFPVVPLVFLRKSPVLADFDLYDEAQSAVPMCTSQFTSGASVEILKAASTRAGLQPDRKLLDYFQEVVSRRRAGEPPLPLPPILNWLVERLDESFLLMAELPDLRKRRILKFRYEGTSGVVEGGLVPHLLSARSLALVPTRSYFAVDPDMLRWSHSYHFEVESPDGAQITSIRWWAQQHGLLRMRKFDPDDTVATGSLSHLLWTVDDEPDDWDPPFAAHPALPRLRDVPADLALQSIRIKERAHDTLNSIAGTRALLFEQCDEHNYRHLPRMSRAIAKGRLQTRFVLRAVRVRFYVWRTLPRLWTVRRAVQLTHWLFRRPPGPSGQFGVVVTLVPEIWGIPAAGLLSGMASTLILMIGAANQGRLFPTSSSPTTDALVGTAAAVLLAVPVTFAGIAARPMHTVTARIHTGSRALLWVVAAVSLAAASTLIASHPPDWMWWLFGSIAAAATAVFAASILGSVTRNRAEEH